MAVDDISLHRGTCSGTFQLITKILIQGLTTVYVINISDEIDKNIFYIFTSCSQYPLSRSCLML